MPVHELAPCLVRTAMAMKPPTKQISRTYTRQKLEQMNERGTTHDGQEGEYRDSAETAGEDNGANQVQDRRSGDAFYCLFICRNGNVAIGQDGEEVRVDAQNDGGATKCQGVEEGLEQAQRASFDDAHIVCSAAGCRWMCATMDESVAC